MWKPQSIRSYSAINTSPAPALSSQGPGGCRLENDEEFYKWFSGFTDAEGNFLILTLPKGFNFKFSIGLHIDDLPVLNYIKDKLGFGIVYAYKTNCFYSVTKKRGYIKNNLYF